MLADSGWRSLVQLSVPAPVLMVTAADVKLSVSRTI